MRTKSGKELKLAYTNRIASLYPLLFYLRLSKHRYLKFQGYTI